MSEEHAKVMTSYPFEGQDKRNYKMPALLHRNREGWPWAGKPPPIAGVKRDTIWLDTKRNSGAG